MGRPYIAEYDTVSKICETCGDEFFLRDREFQSYNRFMGRRFCSQHCVPRALGGHVDSLWSRVNIVGPDECWEWQGRKTQKGYGRLERNGKTIRAHRLAYEIANGPIPCGKMVLHSCDNPPCCNPAHLRMGTARDNAVDAITRGRFRGTENLRNRSNVIAFDKADPRIFEGTLGQAAQALGVSISTIHRVRMARN